MRQLIADSTDQSSQFPKEEGNILDFNKSRSLGWRTFLREVVLDINGCPRDEEARHDSDSWKEEVSDQRLKLLSKKSYSNTAESSYRESNS